MSSILLVELELLLAVEISSSDSIDIFTLKTKTFAQQNFHQLTNIHEQRIIRAEGLTRALQKHYYGISRFCGVFLYISQTLYAAKIFGELLV